jgi:hypothetical protein
VPRKGRGGARNGRPQTAYPNRSDLNAPKVPVVRLQGQTYGEQAQQVARQQAVPPAPPPAPGRNVADVALQHPFPAVPPMDGETAYPREPLTAGMAMGAGPGPEALSPMMSNQTPSQADLERMRLVLPAFEAIADLPDSSPDLRAWVGQMRGLIRSR